MSLQKSREHAPLLMNGSKLKQPKQLILKGDREKYEEESPEEKAREEELFSETMNRGASLLFQDTLILLLQLVQLFCVAESLGLRWVWPFKWIKRSYYIYIINLDVWDFMKVHLGVHEDLQNHHVPSEDMPCNYWLILLAWGVVICLGLLIYVLIYARIHHKHDVLMLSQVAKMQWVYLVLLQCLALPFGVATGRVFHCNDKGKVDIDNNLSCYTSHHWAYIVPVCMIWIIYYIVLSVWLIYKTRIEMLSMPSKRHEAYLQLKEIEFVHGLDVDWMVGHFHVFSSFRKWGSYYRAAVHIFIGIVVLLFAVMHKKENAQAIILTCLCFAAFLTACIIRPFRVKIFNAALCISLFCIFGAFLTGSFISSFDYTSVQSVYLTEKYMASILAVDAVIFLSVGLVIPLLYIILRHNQRTCCPCCLQKEEVKRPEGIKYKRRWEPLWPALSSSTLHKINPHTRKFIKAILRGRVISEKILLMPPLFAPAHELARHIHVVNAYCREAEYLEDPMQSTLWDLLDELIDAHERVAPKSLFAESVKPSIKKTANEFLEMMPAFTRRLAQREYDFLLMRPIKRRMLLKMYIMGLFLNNRREKAIRQRLTVPHLEKVWRKTGPLLEEDEIIDDGYYEDMYPALSEQPSTYRPDTAIALDLLTLQDADMRHDDAVLDAAEQWTQEHPVLDLDKSLEPLPDAVHSGPHQYTNLVFTDDLSETSSVITSRSRERSDVPDLTSLASYRHSMEQQQNANRANSQISLRSAQASRSVLGSQVSLKSQSRPTASNLIDLNEGSTATNASVENIETASEKLGSSSGSQASATSGSVPSSSGPSEYRETEEQDKDAVIVLKPEQDNSSRPKSSHSRIVSARSQGRVVTSRPSSGRGMPAEVSASQASLRSNQSQVHVAGQEEDPADMPTEFAV